MTVLESIQIRGFPAPDQAEVERLIASRVAATPDDFLRRFEADPRSFGGRFVSADLFKEMFAVYAQSRESRDRYNTPVHNAAAVLSSAQVLRVIQQAAPRQTAVLLTGIPGAGKTSTVLAAGGPADDMALIFEGQLSRPEPGIEKMRAALDAGLRFLIVALHRLPEDALQNTLQRFNGLGRGAAITTMASIQGGLAEGLSRIHDTFGSRAELVVRDYRNRTTPVDLFGWEHLSILTSEGTRDDIHRRLELHLNQLWKSGDITPAAFRQAAGREADQQHV